MSIPMAMQTEVSKYTLYQKQYDFIKSDEMLLAFVGGIGSGKTVSGAHWALKMINDHPEHPGLIFSNTHKQLHTSTIPEFSEILASYHMRENIHYVVNKNPLPYFKYESKFKDHNGIWSFKNGAQVITFSLESMMQGISVAWALGDEVQSSKKKDLDVVTGRVRLGNNPLIRYTMTPPMNNPEINELIFGEKAIPKIHATTYDNAMNLPAGYIKLLEDTYDPLTFEREVMGREVTNVGNRFMYSFEDRHIADSLPFDPKKIVYLSFDFNISPMTCVVWQQGPAYIHFIDEFVIDDASVYKMCERIRGSKYWGCHFLVTGDSTSDKRDINQRNNRYNSWSIIKDELELSIGQIKHNGNPTVETAQVLCNSILAKHPDIKFARKMKNTIRDLRFVQVDHRNKIVKKDRKDINQQSDLLDCCKYALHTFHFDFVAKLTRQKRA